jgi:hypothetical protein
VRWRRPRHSARPSRAAFGDPHRRMPRPRSATIRPARTRRLQPVGVSCVLQVGCQAPQILCRMPLARDLDWRCHFLSGARQPNPMAGSPVSPSLANRVAPRTAEAWIPHNTGVFVNQRVFDLESIVLLKRFVCDEASWLRDQGRHPKGGGRASWRMTAAHQNSASGVKVSGTTWQLPKFASRIESEEMVA